MVVTTVYHAPFNAAQILENSLAPTLTSTSRLQRSDERNDNDDDNDDDEGLETVRRLLLLCKQFRIWSRREVCIE